jgi:Leucine-rich repeat (LRR) protein
MEDRVEAIKTKLDLLKSKDTSNTLFGAKVHEYKFKPVLNISEIEDWEIYYKTNLPNDYKEFLTRIANGGVGPYYGLYSLDQALSEIEKIYYTEEGEEIHLNEKEFISKNFKVDKKMAIDFLAHYDKCIEDGDDDEIKYFDCINITGVILLAEYGCGWFYYLVVNGDLAGTVWYGGDYLSPCFREGKIFTFAEWYEDWLDTSLETFNTKQKKNEDNDFVNSTILNFDGNQLKEIPAKVLACKNLRKLIFSRNPLSKFPIELTELKNLRTLDLSMTSLTEIPEDIKLLPNLKKLHLNYNHIVKLPQAFGDLEKLEELYMYYNTVITEMPIVISKLVNLKRINFSQCDKLSVIPNEISLLQNLEFLSLADTKVQELPNDFGKLRNLKSLTLTGTLIKTLPASFSELKNLEYLLADADELDVLNLIDRIKDLPKLHCLKLSLQKDYPKELHLLTKVKTLYIKQNYTLFRQGYKYLPIPENITQMPNVEILDLVNNNQANALPQNIGHWQKLEQLDITCTAIKEFPESLKQIETIKKIGGNLQNDTNKSFGLNIGEKEKVKKWFPNANISIW